MYFSDGLSSIILFENNYDDGLVPEEEPAQEQDPSIGTQEAPQATASETEQQSVSDQTQEVPSEEDLLTLSIDTTQDLFTKVYLIKRIDRLKDWINYLMDQLDKKIDADELYTLENYRTFIDILSNIDIAMPTAALYHIVAQIEIELAELLRKIKEGIGFQNDHPEPKDDSVNDQGEVSYG